MRVKIERMKHKTKGVGHPVVALTIRAERLSERLVLDHIKKVIELNGTDWTIQDDDEGAEA